MALKIPNLDHIIKQDPKAGEALKKVEDYENRNVAQAAGNAVTPPASTTTGTAPSSAGPPDQSTAPPVSGARMASPPGSLNRPLPPG